MVSFRRNVIGSVLALCLPELLHETWGGPDISMENGGKQVSVTFYKMFIHTLAKQDDSGESWTEVLELE